MSQAPAKKPDDLLRQYTLSAGKLRDRLERICANKQEMAASLARVALALRSMGTARQPSK